MSNANVAKHSNSLFFKILRPKRPLLFLSFSGRRNSLSRTLILDGSTNKTENILFQESLYSDCFVYANSALEIAHSGNPNLQERLPVVTVSSFFISLKSKNAANKSASRSYRPGTMQVLWLINR